MRGRQTAIGVAVSGLLLGMTLLAACAPAPLYTRAKPVPGAVTSGEVPRDAWGEPVWSAIHTSPRPLPPVPAS